MLAVLFAWGPVEVGNKVKLIYQPISLKPVGMPLAVCCSSPVCCNFVFLISSGGCHMFAYVRMAWLVKCDGVLSTCSA